tara:strand:+ start:641 stop:748 length:108 start_codon:yes stop_codon:yes gene_type:complete
MLGGISLKNSIINFLKISLIKKETQILSIMLKKLS